jgi:hypothetical protein
MSRRKGERSLTLEENILVKKIVCKYKKPSKNYWKKRPFHQMNKFIRQN